MIRSTFVSMGSVEKTVKRSSLLEQRTCVQSICENAYKQADRWIAIKDRKCMGWLRRRKNRWKTNGSTIISRFMGFIVTKK